MTCLLDFYGPVVVESFITSLVDSCVLHSLKTAAVSNIDWMLC
jgi:hypothetical protein